MSKYLITKEEIDFLEGDNKIHFLNSNARRVNKSLGDLTGITGFGFHMIEVPVDAESTEYHVHLYEDECTYVLSGNGKVVIGEESFPIKEGDFIGYRAGGLAHSMINIGSVPLKCIVVGQRLNHDVSDYPNQDKRLYRNKGQPWNLVEHKNIHDPK